MSRPGSNVASIALVVLLGFVLPVMIARHYHALGVPRGDDWSYLRTLFHWADTGHLNFNNWVTMTLVGQLVLAAPIALVRGHDTTSVQLLTAALGVVGLIASMFLARACGIGRGAATFLAVILTAGPVFGVLAVSYMTDVPAFGCSLLALAVGVAALRRQPISLGLLATSLGIGLFAFSIREYAAIPAIAVVGTAVYALAMERDTRRLRWVLAYAAATAIGAFAIYTWVRTIPDPKPFDLGFPTRHAISTANAKGAGMLRLIGFWLVPAVLWAGPIAIVRRAWASSRATTLVFGVLVGGWLTATGVKQPRNAFTGNYFIPEGALGRGVGSGVRPRLIPLRVFELFVAIGTVSAVIIVLATIPGIVAIARSIRERRVPTAIPEQLPVVAVGVAAFGYASAYVLAALAGLPLYDRYTLPLVPLAGVMLLRFAATRAPAHGDGDGDEPATPSTHTATWRYALAGVALAALFATGLQYTADSASYDAARWRVAQSAVRAGWDPRQVGGNFEWVNFYALYPGSDSGRSRQLCVLVAVGQHGDARTRPRVARGTYSPPFRRSIPVIAYRTRLPCTRGETANR